MKMGGKKFWKSEFNPWMNFNSTEWFAEMDWENFEKDRKSFCASLKIWHKRIPVEEQYV